MPLANVYFVLLTTYEYSLVAVVMSCRHIFWTQHHLEDALLLFRTLFHLLDLCLSASPSAL